ncbi:hypothetical protein GPA_05830 [Gordonibacter pamelaeae 7-10-1-b]|uniref:Uncharacterized protein n=1 Tax=Gordonibacter pamelaeae 7-10-1-b TaxID=657308 RepID=D6E715_9ACTN|nr:hypothetical protein GPA_05830 [Gordonibacter pamelaeae 7-10-1-b]
MRVALGYVVALSVFAECIDSFDFFGHLFLLKRDVSIVQSTEPLAGSQA